MKIEELENAPQWLLDAKTEDADVEILSGVVYWYDSSWKNGNYHGGTWYGGIWRRGFWHRGIWKDGTWYGGRWKKGHKTKLVQSDTSPVNN